MATIYRASLASIILVSASGIATALGIVENLTLSKQFENEALREIGNFFSPEIVVHGVNANFSWGKAWQKGLDLVSEGLIPADATIAQYEPFMARIIDQESQRLIALLHRGVPNSLDVAITARQKLMQNVSGIAVSVLFESELN